MIKSTNSLVGWFSKYRYAVIPATIFIFLISLFMAIYNRIDGLGIFSISASIIFLFLLIYTSSNSQDIPVHDADDENTDRLIEKNALSLINNILHPKYLPLLIKILTSIIACIDKNREKLTQEEINIITLKMNDLNKVLNQEMPKHSPRPPLKPKM